MQWFFDTVEDVARRAIQNPFVAFGLLALLAVVIYHAPEEE